MRSAPEIKRLDSEVMMKDSGIPWLGEVPAHWSTWKITHGFRRIGSGTTPKSDNSYYYGGDIPWVTTSELRERVIDDTIAKVTTTAIRDYPALHIYPSGTLLFAMYGATIGRLGILGIPAAVNQACVAFSDPFYFDIQFVYYWFQMRKPVLLAFSAGGGQPNLSQEDLRQVRIPVPSIDEQRAIADYLDRETARLDALVAAKERLLELLAEKRQALITRAVTRGLDPQAPLRDSGISWLGKIPEHWQIKRARWLFRERDRRSETGDEELLTVSHLTGVTPRSEKEVYMFAAKTKEGYKICVQGDLVINTLWAWMGAMGVSPVNGIVSPAYNVYEPTEQLDPAYVDALVRLPVFAQEVTRYSKGVWSSRLRLYPEGFFEVFLPVPPLSEQQKIVAFLDADIQKLGGLRVVAENTITLLKERRAALIAEAITGRIDTSRSMK